MVHKVLWVCREADRSGRQAYAKAPVPIIGRHTQFVAVLMASRNDTARSFLDRRRVNSPLR